MVNSLKRHGLCDSVLSYERNRWKFEHVISNSMGNKIWSKSSFDMNNSDGKASLKRQKSPEIARNYDGYTRYE